jgi:hypothetical protein
MTRYDIKCPICGCWNRALDLDDSNNRMECADCRQDFVLLRISKTVAIPLVTQEQLKLIGASHDPIASVPKTA